MIHFFLLISQGQYLVFHCYHSLTDTLVLTCFFMWESWQFITENGGRASTGSSHCRWLGRRIRTAILDIGIKLIKTNNTQFLDHYALPFLYLARFICILFLIIDHVCYPFHCNGTDMEIYETKSFGWSMTQTPFHQK